VRGLPQQQCAGVGRVVVTSGEAGLRRRDTLQADTPPFAPGHWSLSMLQPHYHCLRTAPTGESPSKPDEAALTLEITCPMKRQRNRGQVH